MRTPRGLLLLTLVPLVATAGPRVAEELTVVGFSDDGARFALVIAAPGAPSGVLWTWDLATGKAQADKASIPVQGDRRAVVPKGLLASAKLGNDAGAEKYRSGTATFAGLALDGAPLEVRLRPVEATPSRSMVQLKRGSCEKALPLDGEGTDANLSSVLVARDGVGLAVISKYTTQGVRRFRVAATRVDGELATAHCRDEAKALAKPLLDAVCGAALIKLAGHWAGQKTSTDFEGGGKVTVYSVTIEQGEGRPHFLLWVEPGVGPQITGPVVGCTVSKGTLRIEVEDDNTREHGVSAVELAGGGGSSMVVSTDAEGELDTFTRIRTR